MTLPAIAAAALLFAAALLLVPTLPLTLELLALSLAALTARDHKLRTSSSVTGPLRLAVIVPAHNEETLITPCVRSLLASAAEAPNTTVDIYVIVHNTTDQTAAAALAAGARPVILNEPIGGKGLALDYGFTHALAQHADAVLVIDADSVVSPELISAVATTFRSGAAALQVRYEVANAAANSRTRLATLAFRGINVLRPLGRAQLGLSAGILGNGFGLSAATIRRVPYVANSIVEDLEYHLNLIRAGIRVQFLNNARVLGEMPTGGPAAATQRARWEGGRILMRRRWAGPLAAKVLTGNLRLLEPLLDLLAQPLATQAALLVAAGAFLAWPLAHGTALAPLITAYAAISLAAIVLYVLVAALLGPEPLATLAALASVPGYLFFKILLIPRTRLAARKDAAWVRTARNADAPTDPAP